MDWQEKYINKIVCGDCLEGMRELPDESVNSVITSPPYWGLRDYGVEGQFGLEKTFNEYINKLCGIFDEVKRVLRKDGTCWVNLGDTYGGSGNGSWNAPIEIRGKQYRKTCNIDQEYLAPPRESKNLAKSLCLIPFRFAIEMSNRGWILRNTIIWHKPNCMPSSANDRFTVDFDYVFFFVKSKSYWFEQQFESQIDWRLRDRINGKYKNEGLANGLSGEINPQGRNKRCVWTIPTQPFKEAHFATFPEKLVEPMIKSGCPEFVCKQCGKAKEKIMKTDYIVHKENPDRKKITEEGREANNFGSMRYAKASSVHTELGYTDCGCNAGFEGGIALDPFAGAGTTCLVAKKLDRKYIGIEMNPEYCEMAEKRLAEIKFIEQFMI